MDTPMPLRRLSCSPSINSSFAVVPASKGQLSL
jgi:hypothetical protein